MLFRSCYKFSIGKPEDIAYLIDYKGLGLQGRLDREYMELFEAASFEYVSSFFGYHYFRSKTNPEVVKTIKSERRNRGEAYQRIKKGMAIIGGMNLVIGGINMVNSQLTPGAEPLFLLSFVNILCALLMLGTWGMLTYKQKLLKEQEDGVTYSMTPYQRLVKVSLVLLRVTLLIGLFNVFF